MNKFNLPRYKREAGREGHEHVLLLSPSSILPRMTGEEG
jgi:hypothetical protein